MCKKVIYLVSFVLVLGVAAGVTNAEIIGYWPFDEGTGNVAYDDVGNHDGQFTGTPTWLSPGQLGAGALGVDGSNYVNCGSVSTAGDITVAFWLKADSHGNQRPIASSNGDYSLEPGWMLMLRNDSPPGGLWFRLHGSDTGGWAGGDLQINETVYEANTWVHMVITLDGVTREMNGYINGELRGTAAAADGRTIANTVQDLRFGNTGTGETYSGAMDEVAIWDHALTPDEALAVYTLGPLALDPRMAGKPNPDDEATDVPRDVVLSWTPGEYAPLVNGHTVYLSDNFNDVNDAVGGIAQDANSYTPLQRLDFNTTYYWRVDEVNAPPTSTVFEGRVWSFTTEPVGYPIAGENITATASSSFAADQGPENTINGSGLDANDLHSMEPTDMWISLDEPNGAWIEYELDKVYKLHEMWVWNSNGTMESVLGFGLKDVTIEYSTNGTDYTPLGTTHEFVRAPGLDDYAHNTTVDLNGAAAKYVRLTANSNWGDVLDQYGLSEVRFFYIPVRAREPQPESGATDVAVDMTLSFRAGRDADTHDVYLSSDEQAVIDGNAPVTTVTEASYGPLLLDLDTTYYWKINEVNEAETPTTWQGEIWNFSTPEFFVVDDFEDYNDYPPDEIWSTWVDGYGILTNGATSGYPDPDFIAGEHYMETTIVHGGDQSMPFFYSNTGGATHSEGARTFAIPQDWAKAGIQTLTLYFHGTAGNTGQLYVKVNGSKVLYDGNATNLALMSWQQWNIDLASLGVDLQSVSSLAIGIDGSGASGTLYFDDIRLYRLAPAPITEWRITAGSDDAEEDVGGSASFEIDLGSTDLELMYDNNPADPLDEQVVGLRFVGIAIPKGSTITEAWVQFDADDVDDAEHVGNAYILIDGELNPEPVTFENTPNNITGRPRTTAQVSWTSEPWPVDDGTHQKALTPDISSIIQEIVNQDGWAGSALVLIFSQDPATPSVGHRECESFTDNATSNIDRRPTLHITYQ